MQYQSAIVRDVLNSKLLRENPAGVSCERPITLYIPKSAQADKSAKYPVVYLLAPWTNAGRAAFDWRPFKESLPERLDRLIEQNTIPPIVVASVDLYTDFGGSQFVDSTFFGPHAQVILKEVFPFVESKYPVLSGKKHRAIMGRSSGGFGALRLAMDFPDSVSALACHAGDMGFDLLFTSDLTTLCDGLAYFEGDPRKFIKRLQTQEKLSSRDIHILMLLGTCGFYSPNLKSPWGYDFPIDLKSGKIVESVWEKWLAHDPVVAAERAAKNLSSVPGLFIDCGLKDQYRLLYGARQLHQKLENLGVNHTYQEFDDNHSGTEYRFDVSLPFLTGKIS